MFSRAVTCLRIAGAGLMFLFSLPACDALGQEADDEPLITDRPDFTEASSTVGRGRVQLESGYTFGYDDEAGSITRSHSYPEALWRIGVTDDIEFRIAWSYLAQRVDDEPTIDGALDLYLGTKLFLMPQQGLLPESSLILQMTAPTGAAAFSADEVLYGFNWLYSWDLGGGWSLGASSGINTGNDFLVIDGLTPLIDQDNHVIASQSVALGIPLTDVFGAYVEYFGLYSMGRESNFPENYFDGGFTMLLNNNLQLDWRIGVGLNRQAEDLFTGAGFSLRL